MPPPNPLTSALKTSLLGSCNTLESWPSKTGMSSAQRLCKELQNQLLKAGKVSLNRMVFIFSANITDTTQTSQEENEFKWNPGL